MLAAIVPLSALLAGVALLLTGSGLLGTLLALRGSLEGFGEQTLGLIMSCYFAGFLAGTWIGPPAIQRMGHIRAFAFFAALGAVTALAHPIFVDPLVWGLLRFGTGVALVCMFAVIESWLNASVDGAARGRIFAVYMVVNLLAMALGQQLLTVAPMASFVLFSLVAMLFSLALMPVAATRLGQPAMQALRRFGPRRLFAAAPASAVGALCSGLMMGAFWGLAPVYAGRLALEPAQVATFMSVAILGGAALQWPIGRISDGGDRRATLSGVCALAAGTAILAASWPSPAATTLYGLYFLYGGLAFAVYPVVVAHLLDHVPIEEVLPACTTVLLVHGFGSAIGPAVAGVAMEQFGPRALPAYFALVNLVLAAFVAYRLLAVPRPSPRGDSHFHPMLRTTPSAMELLPEGNASDETATAEVREET